MKTDLTAEQKDYARFLPALSGFYATYVGKQRFDEYVETSRIPSNLKNGVETGPDKTGSQYNGEQYAPENLNVKDK